MLSKPRIRSSQNSRRNILKSGLAALAMPAFAKLGFASTGYPSRPIRLIVPFGVGGPVDIVARVIAPPLGEALGGTVIVENKLGASGNIGAAYVARAEPDGYTALVASSNFVINTFLYSNVPYDAAKDFVSVVELAETPSAFAVRTQLGPKSLKEFIDHAKNDGSFSYSYPGFGTVSHMAAEFLKIRGGFNMTPVPHNGGGPAMQTLLTGTVQFCSAALPAIQPHIKSGLVVGLGVTSVNRWPELSDVPTVIESGYPDFNLANFTALLLPAQAPPEIVERLSAASIKILNDPAMRTRLLTLGFEVTARPPQALQSRIIREIPFWKQLVQQAGIKPA